MNQYLVLALLGLGAGALYATLAQGLIIAYRASGVVNFAHGAVAMYGAYTFVKLRTEGRLVLPPLPNPLSVIEWLVHLIARRTIDLPNLPTSLSLGVHTVGTIEAFALTLVVTGLLGALAHILVFRPLRSSPAVAKVVASVGLMLTLQAVASLRFGSDPVAVPKFLPTSTVRVLDGKVPLDRFILAGVAIVGALLLSAAFRWTRFGWATQAAAESEKGAILSGLSPDRLALTSWVLSAVSAGAMGVLFSTMTTLTPTNFTLFILPALAAALVGGFRSPVIATVAGLGIGLIEGAATILPRDLTWLPETGAGKAIPVIIVMAVLVVRSRPIPGRGAIIETELPAAPEPRSAWRLVVPLAILGTLGSIWLPFGYRGALINTFIGAIVALSLVIIVGFVGQISLMQMSLAGLAALAMTRIAGSWGVPFPLSCLLAAVATAVVGAVVATPASRIRGVQLAIVTITVAVTIDALILRNAGIVSSKVALGSVRSPTLFGVRFGINDKFLIDRDGIPNPGFALACLLVLLVCVIAVLNWRRNTTGRLFLAIRSNERAAAAVGIDVARVKVIAFTVSAFVAGLAGSLSAYRFEGLSADGFGALISVSVFAVAYLGGITTAGGAILAGMLITGGLGPKITTDVFHQPRLEQLIAGVGLILTVIWNPRGMVDVLKVTFGRLIGAARGLLPSVTRAGAATRSASRALE